MKVFFRFLRTIKDLKFLQITYRIKNIFKTLLLKVLPTDLKKINPKDFQEPIKAKLNIKFWYSYSKSSQDVESFSFLNKEVTFNERINWEYDSQGKLWLYNLGYFDYLRNSDRKAGITLLTSFYNSTQKSSTLREPYPTSLRNINVIKFLSCNDIRDDFIFSNLRADSINLEKNLEFHLLGNHLLENLLSLVATSAFFNDKKQLLRAKGLLILQLKEQILEDGAHFELSPMYHQILLYRLLDVISILRESALGDKDLQDLLNSSASLMMEWLKNITFRNGTIPLFNDSALGISPDTAFLIEYFNSLGLEEVSLKLTESGFRYFNSSYYECFVDVGPISSALYQPGHGHSDCLSFELQVSGNLLVCDAGVGTYEAVSIRDSQRSTEYHNTVTVNKENQSELWGVFRVGRKAKVIKLLEKNNMIEASHNGYEYMGIYHNRRFSFNEKEIFIEDILEGSHASGIANFHFPPHLLINKISNNCFSVDGIKFTFDSPEVTLNSYIYSERWNTFADAKKLSVAFKGNLKTVISI